ncbi:hypothetical protein F5884DRAFT_856271 [Xylogone sp. PMI_703]|nr:hypothetical protein F5884DRAFT_856271 [Xylogone sp. PMI_703]
MSLKTTPTKPVTSGDFPPPEATDERTSNETLKELHEKTVLLRLITQQLALVMAYAVIIYLLLKVVWHLVYNNYRTLL